MFTPQLLLIGLAVFMLAIYLPALVHPKKFQKALRNYAGEKEVVRISGIMMLLLSLMFFSVHWKINGGWMMTVSLVGWAIFVKGLMFTWDPEFIKRIVKKSRLYKTETSITIMAIAAILIAAALVYIATEILVMGDVVAG